MRGTPFLYQGFVGGLNTIDSPYTLKDDETRDCLNVVSTTRGAIRKRTGSTQFLSAPPAVELHSVTAVNIAGVQKLVAAGGGNLYSISTAGAITTIGTGFNATARWEIVQAPAGTGIAGLGPVYMVNGVDAPQEWTGSGSVAAWTGVHDAAHYGTSPYVPNGSMMRLAGNRIWMAGVSGDTSAVWFSDIVSAGAGGGIGDPTSWPLTNVVRFDPSDQYPITALGTVGPYVLVFKPHKMWVIHDLNYGYNRQLADNVGCVANRSVVETEAGTFFLTADKGVYLTNGASLHELSYNVRPNLLAINAGQRQNAAGGYFNNHYLLSFASGASASNNRTLDYDVNLKAWWLHDLAANQWTIWEPASGYELHAAKPGVSKGIVHAFVPGVFTDVGQPYAGNGVYSAYWLGAWQVFSYYIFRHRVPTPFLKKRVRQVHFDGSGVIVPVLFKNFATSGNQLPGVVGSMPEFKPELPVNFSAGAQVFGNTDVAQVFGGQTYGGVQMIFGGTSTTQDARIYAPGVFQAISVGFGNSTGDPFEVDSYAAMIQFRKS